MAHYIDDSVAVKNINERHEIEEMKDFPRPKSMLHWLIGVNFQGRPIGMSAEEYQMWLAIEDAPRNTRLTFNTSTGYKSYFKI